MDLTQLRQDLCYLNQSTTNETSESKMEAIMRCNEIVSSVTRAILSSKPEDRETLIQSLDNELLIDVFQTMEREFDPSVPASNPSELYAICTMLDIIIIDLYTQSTLPSESVALTMTKIITKCKISGDQADTKSFRNTIQIKLLEIALLQSQMLAKYYNEINVRRYNSSPI